MYYLNAVNNSNVKVNEDSVMPSGMLCFGHAYGYDHLVFSDENYRNLVLLNVFHIRRVTYHMVSSPYHKIYQKQ